MDIFKVTIKFSKESECFSCPLLMTSASIDFLVLFYFDVHGGFILGGCDYVFFFPLLNDN